MSRHVSISPNEAADRLAIRGLIEAYAYCADRRDAKGQMSFFTADSHFVVYTQEQISAHTWGARITSRVFELWELLPLFQ